MSDFLPVAVVFVVGFVAYLGKLGVAGALARRKEKTARIAASKEKIAQLEALKIKIIADNPSLMMDTGTPFDRLSSMSFEDRKEEIDSWNSAKSTKEFREEVTKHDKPGGKKFNDPNRKKCKMCSCWLDTGYDAARGWVDTCVPCQNKQAAPAGNPKPKSVEERWLPPFDDDEISFIPRRAPTEEVAFQATEGDLEWYAKMLRERYKLKDRKLSSPQFKFFKPEDGVTHTLRILPPFVSQIPNTPWNEAKLFAAARQHYVDPSNGSVLQCGKNRGVQGRWEGNCPICEHYEHVSNKIPRTTVKEASKFKPVERFYYNVAHVVHGVHSMPMIWSVSRHTHEKIQQEIMNSGEDLSNLMTGRNVKVMRDVQQHGSPMIEVEFDYNQSMIGRENIQNWMANLWNLEEYVRSLSQTQEKLEAAAEARSGLRRCAHCKKLHKSATAWCSIECQTAFGMANAARQLSATAEFYTIDETPSEARAKSKMTAAFCQSGDLGVGNWVHWETQSGTMSVRPSVVYKTEATTVNGKLEQSVMLKYRRSGGWCTFWVPATKCKLLSLGRPSISNSDDASHIEKMYDNFKLACPAYFP